MVTHTKLVGLLILVSLLLPTQWQLKTYHTGKVAAVLTLTQWPCDSPLRDCKRHQGTSWENKEAKWSN